VYVLLGRLGRALEARRAGCAVEAQTKTQFTFRAWYRPRHAIPTGTACSKRRSRRRGSSRPSRPQRQATRRSRSCTTSAPERPSAYGAEFIVHFPAGEHEELVAAWLWSELAGVVSHQSALALHRLSDGLSARCAREAAGGRAQGLRFQAECNLAGKRDGQLFGVDVAFGDPMLGQPEIVVADETWRTPYAGDGARRPTCLGHARRCDEGGPRISRSGARGWM
jgi:hypothetical protein